MRPTKAQHQTRIARTIARRKAQLAAKKRGTARSRAVRSTGAASRRRAY